MNLKNLSKKELLEIEGGTNSEPKAIIILGNVIYTNGVGNQNP